MKFTLRLRFDLENESRQRNAARVLETPHATAIHNLRCSNFPSFPVGYPSPWFILVIQIKYHALVLA
jgi:hypothetical protein